VLLPAAAPACLPPSLPITAGLKAIYLSGWQVAGDANSAGQTYPDQSLYPADSVPKVVERINNAFQRADQIQHCQGKNDVHWFAPIVVSFEGCEGACLAKLSRSYGPAHSLWLLAGIKMPYLLRTACCHTARGATTGKLCCDV
jgi:hypothetical protein